MEFVFWNLNFTPMEDWQLDFEWLKVRHIVKETMHRDVLPDLNGILFLIGVQEFGHMRDKFSKEEKQDLMHIAVCKLLSYDGYYEFVGRDEDGWPHYRAARPLRTEGAKAQEEMLKIKAIQYFQELEQENGGFENQQ